MRCVEISHFGGPDVLRVVTRPDPKPGPGELLVRVSAAGINRPDLMQREGKYPPPPGASDIPGLEVAGTVAAVGPDVSGWVVGDTACALVAGGGYAELCIVPAPQALPIPAGCSMVEAAGIPETFFTVWHNLFERGRLRAGETVLVHGGASGIGTAAIALVTAFGATVFVTAGTPAKCAACERLGAARAVNYRTEDFVAVLRAATGRRGVDVILDMVGGDYTSRNLDLLADEGRLVQIAFLNGSLAAVDFWPVMRKRLTITGSTLRARPVEVKGAIARALQVDVWPLVAAGRVKPIIQRTFPLTEAAEAHRALEYGDHVGKLVLTL